MPFGIAAALLILACGGWVLAPDPQTGAEAGRRVYDTHNCARCHMVAGKGNVRFPLDGVAARLTAEDLRGWLTDTAEMEGALDKQPAVRMSEWMKSNRKLTVAEIDALVAYLATLK